MKYSTGLIVGIGMAIFGLLVGGFMIWVGIAVLMVIVLSLIMMIIDTKNS